VRRLLVGIVLVSLWATLVPAFAARSPEAARKRKEAEEQLLAGETDKALALVDEGLTFAPKDKDLLILRGHVLLKRGDYADAAAAYRVYLAAGATARGKRDVSKILDSLDQVASTFVVVVVENGPAEIRLDTRTGKPFCTAAPECRKGVMPGDHLVVIDREGFVRVTRRVVVEAGASEKVAVTLAPRPSPLTVKVTPPGAQVTIDGKAPGAELTAGDHTVVVTADGYLRREEKVQAVAGQPVTVEIALTRGIPLRVAPATARLSLDGRDVKILDGFLAYEPGDRELVVTAPGYHPETVLLPTERLDIELKAVGAYFLVSGGARGAEVTVDGKRVGALPMSQSVELEPGDHEVRVGGFTKKVSLDAGKEATLQLRAERGPRVKAWISASIMVAALGVGTYFATTALSKQKDYDANADEPGVSASDQMQKDLRDQGKRAALLTDVSFGVAAVAMVAGMYWFRTEGRKSAGRLEVRPLPGGVGVAGSF
jgi:hypothetical protein